ncbi:MAG TPA: hypothetical protein PLH57_05180 [Oligoflexia bacterium]|nr:hypothetical protein [Oligoflexia bacterium]
MISLVCLGLASESGAQEKRSRFRSGTEVRGQTNATPKAAPKRSQIKNYSKKYNVVEEDGKKVLYKKRNVVEFDGSMIEGEIRNPNDFYFVHRPEENFGSLLQKRKNFHKEMLRDTVMIR